MKDVKSIILYSPYAKFLFITVFITLYILLDLERNRINYGCCEGKHFTRNSELPIATGITAIAIATRHEEQTTESVAAEEKDFVNTPGCHMEEMKPFPAAVLPFIHRLSAVVCPRVQLLITEVIAGKNYLFLNQTDTQLRSCSGVKTLSDVNCTYMQFLRVNDFRNKKVEQKYFNLSAQSRYLEVGSGNQYFWVKCRANGQIFYNDTLFFLPPPPPPKIKPRFHRKLSVLILGIDSMSHMHYLRSFPQVAEFIKELPHTEFWGYNRIGRNTYPNLLRLLSGLSPKELNSTCYASNKTFDGCHMLWDDFKAAGYTTSYGEDSDLYDIFTYNRRGFKRQPTDYYLRPVMENIRRHTNYETSTLGKPSITMSCTAGRLYQDVLHEFIYKLMPHMRQKPTFNLFWLTSGVHDYFNYAKTLDGHYVRILMELQEQGIMNHTLILLMSDHGLRFQGTDCEGHGFTQTFQGMEEMSQPLLIALYPAWMSQRFPLAMGNLQRNAHSLVTTFDLHETLKDVLHLDQLSDDQVENRTLNLANERGISLFLPVPEERSCTTAQIPGHFCLCFKLRKISRKQSSVQKAAQFVVDSINKLIKPYPQCQPLGLVKVLAAYTLSGRKQKAEKTARTTKKGPVEDYDLKDSEGRSVYQMRVRLKARPGEGRFDASVLLKPRMKLLGPVTRTDKYESKSHCIDDYRLEMFCNCL